MSLNLLKTATSRIHHFFPGLATVLPLSRPWRRYAKKARRSGLTDMLLFLSFDCDTAEDADAVVELIPTLMARGVKVTMAVPGEMLLKKRHAYRELAGQGIEFMNHGGRPHASWRGDQYFPETFYSEMDLEQVIADIRMGHEIVTEITGRSPQGFRAPHFGCYQKEEQLAVIHEQSLTLGYAYCSSTQPERGLTHGPAYRIGSLWEFPVLGSFSNPTCALDSWTYLTNRKDYVLDDSYERLVEETVRAFWREHIPGILTWYVDPAHVIDQAPFERAIQFLADSPILSVDGRSLASMLNNRHESLE